MPLISFAAGQVIKAADHNANNALCVLTDTARTVTVTHTWSASQTFTGGFTTGAAVTLGGNLLFTDATYDIGASGATRPRDLYLSRNAVVGGTLGVTGVATLTAQPVLSSLTASQAVFTDASKGLVSNAITGTGSVVMSASPTLTGTVTAAAANFSGAVTALTFGGVTISAGAVSGVTTVSMSGALTMTAAASQIVPGATSWAVRNNANTADNIIITDAGAVTFRSTVAGITTLTATTLGGTLSTAAQPNVTSVGTLTGLTVSGGVTISPATTAELLLNKGTVASYSQITFQAAGASQWQVYTGNVASPDLNIYNFATLTPALTFAGATNAATFTAGLTATTGTFSGAVSGTTWTGTGQIKTTLTTAQLSLNYDASNYMTVAVGSTGIVTLDAVGTNPQFTFNDQINVAAGTRIAFNYPTNDLFLRGTTIATLNALQVNATFIAFGVTSSEAALKRVGATMQLRVADDTADAAFLASTVTVTGAAPTVAAGQVGLGATTQTTIGANGAASALTANPVGYLIVNIAGTNRIIPYYNA